MEDNTKKQFTQNEENVEKIQTEAKNQTENTKKENRKRNMTRMLIIIAFIAVVLLISFISIRGSYLEYKEIGEEYIPVFSTNLTYKIILVGINFIFLYIILYFTNRGIKKGLKPFFERENKKMPKLLNKSLAFIIATIGSIYISTVSMQKILLFISNASFGMQDPIFNLDIGYYIFQKPVVEMILFYFVGMIIGLSIYMAVYYILIFNICFDGIEGKMLKESLFMKKILRNVKLLIVGIALTTVINTQNIIFGKILTIDGNIELTGAGYTEANIKLWGYVIFSVIMVISVWIAIRNFKKGNTKNILKNLSVIPIYLLTLFLVMIIFDSIFVNSNELDKEKKYISDNIKNTKDAYGINIEEVNLENSGTITEEQVDTNKNVIENIPIITKDTVIKTLEDSQTNTGYYSYRNASLAKYDINGQDKVVYIAPREITNAGRTYNNKTYEYTHGIGQIVVDATNATQTGTIEYVQKEITGKDNKINVTEPRIYFGLETNETIVTNTNNKKEYDYTDENGNDVTSTYAGQAGLRLNFLDKMILGIETGNINLAFSTQVNNESKILINRNVVQRAKKALPYLMYEEEPYTVVTEEGRIVWVIDAYTTSNCYPYSQYTSIEHGGSKQRINYIRNSVKVLIDAYDGTISYYITDKTDPIAMAYKKVYPTIFKEEEIPQDIKEKLVYPQTLYEIQSEVLEIYHSIKPDVIYRADDLWESAKYNNVKSTKSTGNILEPYYTMVNTEKEKNKLGLVQIYTPKDKQNIISYLVGTVNGENNKLTLYKFSEDSNIVGPMQLDKQIEQDEAISKALETLNVTGTKITKHMIIVPIENTLLYVEPIYQTMLNESDVPILKRIIVASGNKVAIGENLQTALQNLLSKYAVDIEVENTDDIEGLIEAIIKANNNLTQSNENNDWEMMGKDIEKLQTLINSLETLKEEEDKKQDEEKNETNTINSNNVNVVNNEVIQ